MCLDSCERRQMASRQHNASTVSWWPRCRWVFPAERQVSKINELATQIKGWESWFRFDMTLTGTLWRALPVCSGWYREAVCSHPVQIPVTVCRSHGGGIYCFPANRTYSVFV